MQDRLAAPAEVADGLHGRPVQAKKLKDLAATSGRAPEDIVEGAPGRVSRRGSLGPQDTRQPLRRSQERSGGTDRWRGGLQAVAREKPSSAVHCRSARMKSIAWTLAIAGLSSLPCRCAHQRAPLRIEPERYQVTLRGGDLAVIEVPSEAHYSLGGPGNALSLQERKEHNGVTSYIYRALHVGDTIVATPAKPGPDGLRQLRNGSLFRKSRIGREPAARWPTSQGLECRRRRWTAATTSL